MSRCLKVPYDCGNNLLIAADLAYQYCNVNSLLRYVYIYIHVKQFDQILINKKTT